jgi:hypothetical protein
MHLAKTPSDEVFCGGLGLALLKTSGLGEGRREAFACTQATVPE